MLEELHNLILSGNIPKALELVHNDQLLPVFVPTYKNREGTFMNKLGEIPSEVHLFLYDDDRHNYPETFPDNVTVHLIHRTENWQGISSKRKYMLEWKKANGIHKCIEMDDDLQFILEYPIKRGKFNKVAECSLWDVLRLLNRLLENKTFGIAGFNGKNIRKYNWNNVLNEYPENLVQCIIQNVDVLKENDITYFEEKSSGEDVQICMECALKGIPLYGLEFINEPIFNIKSGGRKTIANSKKEGNDFTLYFYRKYKGYAKILPNPAKYRLWSVLNWENILNKDDSYDNDLMQACIENNEEKVFEILEKIKEI